MTTLSENLKVRVMAEGLRVSENAQRLLTDGGSRPLTIHDYVTTSGLILRLPGDVYVNAPVNESFAANSPLLLDVVGGRAVLRGPEGEVTADHVPIPDFLFRSTESGAPFRDFGITHTDRFRVSPIAGCAYRCRFCDLPYAFRYTTKSISDLIATAHAALSDPILPARHILISGGTPTRRDRSYFSQSVQELTQTVSVPVDVMMVPWPGNEWLEEFRSWGVQGLFLNLELIDSSAARTIMPQKVALGKDFFMNAIDRAVGVFGTGRVSSLILVGLEPIETTLAGVEELVRHGCIPVLSPFRPSPQTPLATHPPPSFEDLVRVHRAASAICREHGLRLGPQCLPCQHNTLTLPSDS